jgi:L,D-peptidoglycan transpeptidase YkuD (ErfK/YbiS/YcfS/YnhG family)
MPAMRRAEISRGLLAATVLIAATTAASLVPVGPAHAASLGAAESDASSPVRELITVSASSYGTTYATLRAYDVSGKKKTLVFGPWTARVGYNGIAPPGKKREGDGRTPSGTYGFSFFFGVDPRQKEFAFSFRHAYTYDYWDDDPASPRYNEWVDAKTANPGRDPEPMHNVPAYNYAAVIAYNTARTPGLGSAIFLHVGTGTATAGCVSLPQPELLKILDWLRPADNPRISITARSG